MGWYCFPSCVEYTWVSRPNAPLTFILYEVIHITSAGSRRHFVMRGTGDYGIKVSEAVTIAIGCDATVLVDVDYANVSGSCQRVFFDYHSLTLLVLHFD